MKVAYHKAITRDSGLLRAEGRVLSIGRRAAFAEAMLRDMSGRLFASATSTLLVMECEPTYLTLSSSLRTVPKIVSICGISTISGG